jgi:hypothetical protein
MVNRTGPLNARQVEVLRWIADRCPDGVMKDFTYKTTAVALQGRQLVTVSRKGGGWQAAVTEVGTYYLQHGEYPAESSSSDHLSAQRKNGSGQLGTVARSSTTGSVRPASLTVPATSTPAIDRQAENLVRRVIRAGGVLVLDLEDDETDYKALFAAAKRATSLPFGKQLKMRSVGPHWSDEYEIYLDEDFEPRVPSRPVAVPERVAAYHPVVKAYRADPDRHEVSKDSLDRACRALQGLADEVQRRGYSIRMADSQRSVRLKDGQLELGIDGFWYRLRIQERAGSGGEPRPYTPRGPRLPLWREVRQTTFVPTGELRITIGEGYSHEGRPAVFRDTKRASLEERLPALLRELEIRALEDDWRRQQKQHEADLRRRRWAEAIERAKIDFREAQRTAVLTEQLDLWRMARDLDAYLAEMAAVVARIPGKAASTAAEQWLHWVTEYRQRIDPLDQPLGMPTERKPSKEELKPYLNGWSPYGPEG